MANATAAPRSPKQKQKRARVGLSVMEEERLKARMRQTFPSEPWIESCIRRFEDVKADGELVIYRFHNPASFPPRADTTPMVVCSACGRTVPPNSLEAGVCLDHQPTRVHEAYGASPSATAIRKLQHWNLRAEQIRLEPSSKSALEKEIRKYARKLAKKATHPVHVL